MFNATPVLNATAPQTTMESKSRKLNTVLSDPLNKSAHGNRFQSSRNKWCTIYARLSVLQLHSSWKCAIVGTQCSFLPRRICLLRLLETFMRVVEVIRCEKNGRRRGRMNDEWLIPLYNWLCAPLLPFMSSCTPESWRFLRPNPV